MLLISIYHLYCINNLDFPGGRLYVLDSQGGVIGGVASSTLLRLYREGKDLPQPEIRSTLWEVLAGPAHVRVKDKNYLLFVVVERPQMFLKRFHRAFLHNPYGFTGSFIIGLLLCVVLSAYLVGPIRRLQAASQRIAGGDFTTSVGEQVTERNDEFGELGRGL